MTNVVRLKTSRLPTAEESRERIMNVIRDSLYAHGDMIELAQEVGLSASTLFAIRSGRTKWPRHNTIFSLINALGLEMVLQKRRP